jgi:hypothetical protein
VFLKFPVLFATLPVSEDPLGYFLLFVLGSTAVAGLVFVVFKRFWEFFR